MAPLTVSQWETLMKERVLSSALVTCGVGRGGCTQQGLLNEPQHMLCFDEAEKVNTLCTE